MLVTTPESFSARHTQYSVSKQILYSGYGASRLWFFFFFFFNGLWVMLVYVLPLALKRPIGSSIAFASEVIKA